MTPSRLIASMRPIAAAFAVCLSAHAADDNPAPATKDALSAARTYIAARRFDDAVAELRRVNASSSADWNTLLGFAMRKQTTPDLAASERYYTAALRIDPQHRGALEYSGELYLMKGQLAGAQQRLSALGKACAASCQEYQELKTAIDRYKTNGGTLVGNW